MLFHHGVAEDEENTSAEWQPDTQTAFELIRASPAIGETKHLCFEMRCSLSVRQLRVEGVFEGGSQGAVPEPGERRAESVSDLLLHFI